MYNRHPTFEDVAAYSQMSSDFVEQQIYLDSAGVINMGGEGQVEPSASRQYTENRETVSSLVSEIGRR